MSSDPYPKFSDYDKKFEDLIVKLIESPEAGIIKDALLILRHNLYSKKYEAIAKAFNIDIVDTLDEVPNRHTFCSKLHTGYPCIRKSNRGGIVIIDLQRPYEAIKKSLGVINSYENKPCPICFEEKTSLKCSTTNCCFQQMCNECLDRCDKSGKGCPFCRQSEKYIVFNSRDSVEAGAKIIKLLKLI